MKKFSAVAIALLAATSAHAAEVFKSDAANVDLYGRVYAGHFFGTKDEVNADGDSIKDHSAKIGANQFIRFGAKANSDIGNGLSALAQYEAQFNIGDSEKTVKDDSGNLRTRLAYAGVKSDAGTLTFGRQKGAFAAVADWTDVALSDGYGADAMGDGTDNFATDRAGSVLKYAGSFNGFNLEANYKFDGADTKDENDKSNAAAYGLAASYTLDMGLSLGAAYTLGQRDVGDDAKIWVIGAKFDNKALYAAINYADGSDFLKSGTDNNGLEAALGYNFANGVGLMTVYNKGEKKIDGDKTDTVDYFTLGAQYKFNKQMRVIGEYRFNQLDGYKDDFQLAARYDF